MIRCNLCGFEAHFLGEHVSEAHGLAPHEYDGALASPELAKVNKKGKRVAIPRPEDLSIPLMGMPVKVDAGVDPATCLPFPEGYRFPTKGKAKDVFERALMALARGRNVFIWGMPGTGKDAMAHAFSAMARRPAVMVTFRPGTDLAPWFYSRSIGKDGTGWEYGHLWNALTKGVEGRDGERRAPMVVLSDVDRADSAQAEWFRMLTDSISGRILGPNGEMVELFTDRWGRKPQFVCTANSCGTGDERGRMASSNVMDASIMDRLGRKIEATYLDWSDESIVLRAKFPLVGERAPDLFDQLGKATKALRAKIEKEELYAEFTHRGLCEILSEAEDILAYSETAPSNLLARAFCAWTDGLDGSSRLEARRIIDPYVPGGAV